MKCVCVNLKILSELLQNKTFLIEKIENAFRHQDKMSNSEWETFYNKKHLQLHVSMVVLALFFFFFYLNNELYKD